MCNVRSGHTMMLAVALMCGCVTTQPPQPAPPHAPPADQSVPAAPAASGLAATETIPATDAPASKFAHTETLETTLTPMEAINSITRLFEEMMFIGGTADNRSWP